MDSAGNHARIAPLAIDLFCGLGGWTEGLLAENWRVIGVDNEQHVYGEQRYTGLLLLQDVLTLHGSQFRGADLIVASPPCQEFSYMAMPWTRTKAIAKALRGNGEFPPGYAGSRTLADLTRLFDACFRIQREAIEAAGRHIPLVVENVRGAIPWVGRSRWAFGSFHLWGDVPALMPTAARAQKFNPDGTGHPPGSWFAIADSQERGSKCAGFRFDGSGKSFQSEAVKVAGLNWSNYGKEGYKPQGFNVEAANRVLAQNPDGRLIHKRDGASDSRHLTNPNEHGFVAEGRKGAGAGAEWFDGGSTKDKMLGYRGPACFGSKSNSRKAASAMIAKIPLPLARHIGRTFYPVERAA